MLSLLAGVALTPAIPDEVRLNCGQVERAIVASTAEPVPEPGRATDVQLSIGHSLCGGWEIVDFWRSGPQTSTLWRARRKIMAPDGRVTVTLTDSRQCPVMLDVLGDLDALPVSLSTIRRRSTNGALPTPPVAVTDGSYATVRVLSAVQPDRSNAYVTVASNSGALADWVDSSKSRLAACWRPAE